MKDVFDNANVCNTVAFIMSKSYSSVLFYFNKRITYVHALQKL